MKAILTKYRTLAVEIYQFLGPAVMRILVGGMAVGVVLCVVELTVAFGLQIYLSLLTGGTAAFPYFGSYVNTTSRALLFVLASSLLRALLIWEQIYLQGAVTDKYNHLQRQRLVSAVFHNETASSTTVTSLFNEGCSMSSLSVSSIQSFLLQLTTALLIGVALMRISLKTTLLSLVCMTLFVYPALALNGRIKRIGQAMSEEWDRTNRRLLTSIKNLLLLRIYGMERREDGLAQESLSISVGHMLSYRALSSFCYVAPQIVAIVLLGLMTYIAKSWMNLSGAYMISFFYLFLRFAQTISALNRTVSDTVMGWPQVRRLFLWWKMENAGVEPWISVDVADAEFRLSVHAPIGWRLRGVAFAYPQSPRTLYQDVDADIEPGTWVVMTGPSGAGKSTFLHLLLGFLRPTAGQVDIRLDDRILPAMKAGRSIRRHVGYVGTDPFVVEGTVMENLCYGLESAPAMEDVVKAIEQSEGEFFLKMPHGLEHRLTEQGQGLSAGQLQRLSLARALLRRPKVLILDEATANLDSETEERILETLVHLKGQFTIVAVSHRDKLLRYSDMVLRLTSAIDGRSRLTSSEGLAAAHD